ncbi:hypothetical protein amrb99_35320 [Actinomadura sp. RB99]|nr:hypothetical protein [Actinomadura sp. RB99]
MVSRALRWGTKTSAAVGALDTSTTSEAFLAHQTSTGVIDVRDQYN